ncbi:hypothetical protein ASPVEDRAFT_143980 [Aspergillus versicolor CBS 583.65]|uniref:Uncharacterized protein n=1 Tax=Aspergillus versicolor CBS 583.65 TaxID=1036611 RepID=A0A1L9Q392_ASPVE|nr:uncharacterized protein ASPVEDRAFT_143980 [Aspergillus versicolor CBS 583.65]OJJ08217.1 hypothetical protein ASPVEDRAFT_143980 [Aspergillus versicolor CBS 583.65]
MAFTLEIFARKIDDVLSQFKSLSGHIGGAESSINGHKCGMVRQTISWFQASRWRTLYHPRHSKDDPGAAWYADPLSQEESQREWDAYGEVHRRILSDFEAGRDKVRAPRIGAGYVAQGLIANRYDRSIGLKAR